MIRNVVFDMGQVLIRWYPGLHTARYALPEEEEALLIRELFQSVEWVQLDRGTISEQEAVKAVCARLPQKLHGIVEELVTGWWQEPLTPVEGMAELLRELKDLGYGQYLLSNAGTSFRCFFQRIPGMECFDGLLISAEEKLLKPQHEIYEALFQRFGLNPLECFFVDDSPANVEGALSCGMAGVIFRGDTAQLRYDLRRAGIPVTEST